MYQSQLFNRTPTGTYSPYQWHFTRNLSSFSYTPQNGTQNQQALNFIVPKASSSMTASCPAQWQPWMSPYAYEVVLLPNIVKKCYGCGSNFVEKYRSSPHNLVIKHMDRRIAGKDSFGQLRQLRFQ